MPHKHPLAVVILNWNGAALLRRFLPSVLEHSQHCAQVYVIDNASQDDSRAVLAREFPAVQLIALEQNSGYAGGYNQGLQELDEDYAVLLNSDVETSPGWLEPLLARFENNPQLGALQPKIRDLKAPEKFEYAGAAGGFIDRLGYPFCRGRIFDELEEDRGQYNQYSEVFWATGACLVVRRQAFLAAGKLNPHLFAHMEEIDLCWRMQIAGWQVACEPASVVYHLGGATLQKASAQKTYLNFRNSLIIIFLNLPHFQALRIILLRLLLDGLAGIHFLAQAKPRHSLAILRAHFSFYGQFHRLFAQKWQRTTRDLQSFSGYYRGSIVYDYYLRRRRKFSDLFPTPKD